MWLARLLPWKNECFIQLTENRNFHTNIFVDSNAEIFFSIAQTFFFFLSCHFALFLFKRWFRLYLHSYSPPIKDQFLCSFLLLQLLRLGHIHIRNARRLRHGKQEREQWILNENARVDKSMWQWDCCVLKVPYYCLGIKAIKSSNSVCLLALTFRSQTFHSVHAVSTSM